MTVEPEAVLRAFGAPAASVVRKPVAKELIGRQLGATERRQLLDRVHTVTWWASLKPTNIAVPGFQDETHDYSEVQLLLVTLRAGAHPEQVGAALHRAIAYPVAVVYSGAGGVGVSFAHVRRHERIRDAVVLDGEPVYVSVTDDAVAEQFLGQLAIATATPTHLHALVGGWVERAEAVGIARRTGRLPGRTTGEGREQRRVLLAALASADAELADLRRRTRGQLDDRESVDLNLAIVTARKRVEELVRELGELDR